LHQVAQKPLAPAQQQVEVEASGGEDGIDAVAVAVLTYSRDH
jgi:hypothetical protein